MTDKDLADEFRAKILETSEPYLKVMTEAHRAGFLVSATMGLNSVSNEVVMLQLQILKQM